MPSKYRSPKNRLEDYVAAYKKASGEPRSRIRKVAKQLGVSERTVISCLRRAWGERRFRREVPMAS